MKHDDCIGITNLTPKYEYVFGYKPLDFVPLRLYYSIGPLFGERASRLSRKGGIFDGQVRVVEQKREATNGPVYSKRMLRLLIADLIRLICKNWRYRR